MNQVDHTIAQPFPSYYSLAAAIEIISLSPEAMLM